jgi:hypothetical protein
VLDLFDVHLDVAARWSGAMVVGGAEAAARGAGAPARRRAVARRSARKRG